MAGSTAHVTCKLKLSQLPCAVDCKDKHVLAGVPWLTLAFESMWSAHAEDKRNK